MLSLPAIVVIHVIARELTDPETASLLAGALPATVLSGMEYLNYRRKGPEHRIEAAVRGDVFKSPLRVSAYVVVTLQLLQAAISFLVGAGVGAALTPYEAPSDTVQEVAITAGSYVVIPMLAVLLVFVARAATYRIERGAFYWLALALAVTLALNVIVAVLTSVVDDVQLNSEFLVQVAVVYGLYLATAWLGVRWAQRTRPLHAIARAYRELSPTDQRALLDLVLPEVRSAVTGDPQSKAMGIGTRATGSAKRPVEYHPS